jgi:hypothetical protein
VDAFTMPKKQPPNRSQVKKNLYKLMVAQSDIGAAHSAYKLFESNVKELSDKLYQPLFTAIVVCYARPFTNNQPYGALPDKWTKFDNPRQQSLHDDLIKARHEIVAHSDMSVRRASIVPPGVVTGFFADGRELKSTRIGHETSYYLFRIPRIREISDLTVDLGRRISLEIDTIIENLYSGMDLPRAKFRLRIDDGL